MNNLRLKLNNISEVVNNSIIHKLYKTTLEIPEPNEGEEDNAYLSGNLLTLHSYRNEVGYLTTRFPNLFINVTNGYYILFEDPTVLSILMSNNISSDGIAITEEDAATATLGTIFKNNTNITSFDEFKYFTRANTNPSGEMFSGCTNLTSIDLSELEKASQSLFKDTAIIEVNAPNLTEVNLASFSHCTNLLTITSLGHITTIKDSSFRDCENLETVTLPDECVTLEYLAFGMGQNYNQYGGSLRTINGINHVTYFGANCFLRQYNLLLGTNDLIGAVTIGNSAFLYVPISVINCPNLISLGTSAFRENKTALTAIECLGKISSIPDNCFYACNSTLTAKLPYECTNIGGGAFRNCSSLTSITQYNKSLDDYAEGESPIFTDLSRVTSFGAECFYKCNQLLMSGSELSSATYIGHNAFEGVQLSGALDLSSLSGTIGEYTFYNTPITSVTIPLTVTRIDPSAFGNTNLTSITIPLSVQRCSCAIVSGTAVTEIIFPEGCTEITDQQFSTKNNSLVYIEMPSTVTSIGSFFHRSLETSSDDLCAVVIKATTPPTLTYYKNNASNASSTTGNKFSGIYVPDASLTAYQGATGAWQHSSILAKLKPISLLLTDNPTAWARYNRT